MQKRIDAIPVAVMKGLTAWEWPGEHPRTGELHRACRDPDARQVARGSAFGERGAGHRIPASAAAQDDIARIVRETINALDAAKKILPDERSKKQRDEIVRALTESKGRVGGADGAAARMGINRTTLLARMKKLGIDPRQYG